MVDNINAAGGPRGLVGPEIGGCCAFHGGFSSSIWAEVWARPRMQSSQRQCRLQGVVVYYLVDHHHQTGPLGQGYDYQVSGTNLFLLLPSPSRNLDH